MQAQLRLANLGTRNLRTWPFKLTGGSTAVYINSICTDISIFKKHWEPVLWSNKLPPAMHLIGASLSLGYSTSAPAPCQRTWESNGRWPWSWAPSWETQMKVLGPGFGLAPLCSDLSAHCLNTLRPNPALTHGWQGPNHLGQRLLPPRAHYVRRLEEGVDPGL